MIHDFKKFIESQHLFSAKDELLIAVSGGLDSVVLCALCAEAGYHFTIAHCNFQLRGTESDRDETFVRELGVQYKKDVRVKRFDTQEYAAAQKISIQVAARQLRYSWFHDLLAAPTDQQGVEQGVAAAGSLPLYILTAHHLDDNVETILMNFFKGTGIAGLRGMQPKTGKIIRPLLFARKQMLQHYAEENNLSWVEDSSNQSDKYARNYFRNQLIPLVKKLYPEAENNLAANVTRFKDIELLYAQSITQHKKKLLFCKGNEVHLPVLKLLQTAPLQTVLFEIIRHYGFSADQAAETIALLKSETGRYISSSTHRIFKNRSWLVIAPVNSTVADTILIDAPGSVTFRSGEAEATLRLVLQPFDNAAITVAATTGLMDAAGIKFPLLFRKWKPGDYFYPLGMKKKKKLARFFIDQKLSKTEKEKVWVLEADKKIIWVAGYRIDDRFKITPSTKQVLRASQE